MATDRELPDEFDDAQMAWLLKSAYDAPELRSEFASSLAQRLDAEFSALSQAELAALTNGAARRVADAKSAPSGPLRNGAAAGGKRGAAGGSVRPWRRWGVALAAAASLLVLASIWSAAPAYGWAAVLRALDQCTWVQAEAADDQGAGWISASEGVVAVRTRGSVVFDSRREGVSNVFLASEQRIVQMSLPETQTWNLEAELVRLLLGAASEEAGLAWGEPLEIEVVDESWRRVVRPDGDDSLVELQVVLTVGSRGDDERRRLELVLLVDPVSHLPLECRLVESDGRRSPPIEFAYPAAGPQTIFALGVPSGLPIVRGTIAHTDVALTSTGGRARSQTVMVVVEEDQAQDGVDAAEATINDQIASVDAGVDAIKEGTISSGDAAPGQVEAVADLHDVAPPAWTPPATALAPAELSARIDAELAALWQRMAIRRAAPATDQEFMRRVYLDLTGRVPTVSEIHRFEENLSPERRAMLVDDLLAHYDHASHLASVWRRMLLPESADLTRFGGPARFDEWLATRFAANKPYDEIVADLLLAEGRVSESGPMLFYAALKLNPEELAAQTSRAFLGVRMECAQCHDHPFDEVSQQDFWSFAAFFARISRPRGRMEITSPVLAVRDSQQGEVMIPESDEVVPPRLPLSGFDVEDSPDGPPRRQQLVEWLTSPHNPQFARATVNRVWAHLFGRGLVEPVDDMRPDNPPISPELMELLAGDFAASGFDVRRLLRALVLTEAYQLSSQAEADDPSRALHFAQMNIKSFTAEQLYDCIAVATQRAATTATGPADQAALVRFSDTSRQAFIDQFRAPPGQMTDYHAGIPQALTLMHGGLIHGATDLATSGLLKSLAAPFFTDEQRLDALFLATLSRRPDAQERELMLPVVEEATTDAAKQQALGDVLWALLNSAEFTFNH